MDNIGGTLFAIVFWLLVILYFVSRSGGGGVLDDPDRFSAKEIERREIVAELLDYWAREPDEESAQDSGYALELQEWETYFSTMSGEQLRDELRQTRKRSDPYVRVERTSRDSWYIQDKIQSDSRVSRHIPSHVRREIWTRDEGRCVRCGSRENLEYDHIIPVSKGGSNTARNVDLLCEVCNREKSNKIE